MITDETFHFYFLLLTVPREASSKIFSNKFYWNGMLSLFLKWWNAKHFFFLAYFKKPRCKLIPILRFCYFSENVLSLKSYYQLSYVSVWITGILLTIPNILIKIWNVHFHFALDWSNAAWSMWWLKQSIKPYKSNEAVAAINNTSRVYLFECLSVCFLKEQNFNVSPTLALN